MDAWAFATLQDLQDDKWRESLLASGFEDIIKELTKKERIIFGLKIQYFEDGWDEDKANEQIAVLVKLKPASIKRYAYRIKKIFRDGMDTRTDNQLRPDIYRQKVRKIRKNEPFR